jgi:hypothetical protein
MRYIFKLLIGITTAKLLYDFFKSDSSNNLYKIMLRKWLIKFLLLVFVVYFLNFLILMFANYKIGTVVMNITILIMSHAVLLNILYKPKFIGYHKFSYNKLNYFDRSLPVTLTDKNFIIPFFYNQFFLQKDANLDRFCKENSIYDKEDFQDEIILNYNMTFNNLINKYRVQYLTDLIKSNKYSNYSIDALAQESGFSSRHHLYKPFKKFHGGTPTDYIYLTNN